MVALQLVMVGCVLAWPQLAVIPASWVLLK